MTLPLSGSLGMNDIRIELGISTQAPFTLASASLGRYVAINQNSFYKPTPSAPFTISSWYGYNHTAGATPSVTPSRTPSISVSPSITPSITVSSTPSTTPSITITPSITPSISISRTPSVTPSITITPSITPSISISSTPSVTPSITVSPTVTPSISISRTPSITPTVTPTRSVAAASPSVTPTRTPSVTPSASSTSKTVQWSASGITGCTGMSYQIIKNGSTISSGGTDGSGTFSVVVGDVLTVTNTVGPKPGLGCTTANANIGSTPGGGEYASNTTTGANTTATATYTVVSGTASTIYMSAGPAAA